MRRPSGREAGLDRVLPVFVLALLLLSPPAMRLWAQPERPWWLVFAIWALLIGLIAYASGRPR